MHLRRIVVLGAALLLTALLTSCGSQAASSKPSSSPTLHEVPALDALSQTSGFVTDTAPLQLRGGPVQIRFTAGGAGFGSSDYVNVWLIRSGAPGPDSRSADAYLPQAGVASPYAMTPAPPSTGGNWPAGTYRLHVEANTGVDVSVLELY
jgi:hypothetical protein